MQPSWKNLIAFIVVVFLLGQTIPAHAQESSSAFGDRQLPPSAADFYSPPPIYVDEFDVLEGEQGVRHLRFSIYNGGEEVVGDIGYRLELLSPAPETDGQLVNETADVYAITEGIEKLTILPQDTKVVSTLYTIPSVPNGSYRLRVQLVASQSRELGWSDQPLTISESSVTSFALLTPGTFEIDGYDEALPALSGPNINPDTQFNILATARNTGSESTSFTPRVQVYEFSNPDATIHEQTYPPVDIAPAEESQLSVALTSPNTAGVYRARLELVDAYGHRISSLATYHWVVRGKGASIVSARIVDLAIKAGESVTAAIDYTGPADAETNITGVMTVSVIDDSGVAGTFTVPEELELTDEVVQGYAQIPLTRDIQGIPTLAVVVKDTEGNVLTEYSTIINLSEEELARAAGDQVGASGVFQRFLEKYKYVVAIGIIVLVLLVLIITRIFKRSAPVTAVLFFAAAFSMLLTTDYARAQINLALGVPVSQSQQCQIVSGWCSIPGRIIEIFVNEPRHNTPHQPYQNRKAIPFSFRVTFAGCHNAMDSAIVLSKYNLNGNLLRTLSPSAQWQSLPEARINAQCPANRFACQLSGAYNSTLDFSNVRPDKNETTFQVQALYGRGLLTTDISQALAVGQAHIMNIWVNFAPNPQCSDGKDNDADGLIDPNDPGCHVDNNPNRNYVASDDDERDQQNQPPIAESVASVYNAYSETIEVMQGVPFTLALHPSRGANWSRDPDGWSHTDFGISNGGSCEWNADLETGTDARFERVIRDPSDPSACRLVVPNVVVNNSPGTYRVNLLRVRDARGVLSNVSTITMRVIPDTRPDRLVCVGGGQTITAGQPVTVQATSFGNPISVQWDAPFSVTKTGSGSSFTTTFSSVGSLPIYALGLGTYTTCSINVQPAQTIVPPLELFCLPTNQSVAVNQPVSFGVLQHNVPVTGTWSAPEGTPASGSGENFTTRYSTVGNKVVTVSALNTNKICNVQVTSDPTPPTPPPPTPIGDPIVTPTPTPTNTSSPECSDGRDNDGDTAIDCADNGCWQNPNDSSTCNPLDNSEFYVPSSGGTPTPTPGGGGPGPFEETE